MVVVVGAPLDFRLGYGVFGSPASPAKVIHLTDSSDHRRPDTVEVAVRGDLPLVLRGLTDRLGRTGTSAAPEWAEGLRSRRPCGPRRRWRPAASTSDPIHPAPIYGELLPRLADDAVTIGDGGDFVSFAGKYVEPATAGLLAGSWPVRVPRNRLGVRDRCARGPT